MSIPILLMLAVQAAILPQPDPYAPPPPEGSGERLAFDAELGEPKADAVIDAWLTANPKAPAAQRAMLFHRLCIDYGVHGPVEQQIVACTESSRLTEGDEEASDLKIATILRSTPPISATGSATVPLISNPMGSKSANLVVNGVSLPWFVDTGAEISTITESTATKLRVRILEGTTDVGTSTGNRVTGKIGVIDKLTIGTATVEHLPVLILPDAMLTITPDYTIQAILGLPAYVAFGRIAWLDGGKRLALGSAAAAPGGKTVRIYWHEDGVGIPMATPLGVRGVHFDSGADSTSLRTSALALLTKEQAAAATERDVAQGGAGGIVRTKLKVLPRLDYMLAGAPLTAVKLNIEDSDDSAGRVGNDMIVQLQTLTIDFRTMTLSAEPIR